MIGTAAYSVRDPSNNGYLEPDFFFSSCSALHARMMAKATLQAAMPRRALLVALRCALRVIHPLLDVHLGAAAQNPGGKNADSQESAASSRALCKRRHSCQ